MDVLNAAEWAPERRDRELLGRIEARDREAMRELYPIYYRRLLRFFSRLTRRRELVDEMINDTFVVVWQKAGDFRSDSRVSTWIMGIGRRRGLNLLRSEHRAAARMVSPTTSDHNLCEANVEQSQLAEILERALKRLSPDHRAVLELSYYLGHSCDEIALIMNCPANTVKTRMYHARNKLRTLVPLMAAPEGDLMGISVN